MSAVDPTLTKRAFLNSAALRMHPLKDEPKKRSSIERRISYWFFVIALLAGVLFVITFVYSKYAYPNQQTQLWTPTRRAFGWICGGVLDIGLVSLFNSLFPRYTILQIDFNCMAFQIYQMSLDEFYELSEPALKLKAEDILIDRAQKVLRLEAEIEKLQTDTMSEILQAAKDVLERKRASFEGAYSNLKNAGIIRDVGYGYFYGRAAQEIAEDR